MSATTRKVISLFFILLGFTPVLLVLCVNLHDNAIWERMKLKLERQPLEKITIAENKVVWMDKHEIWVNNQMFDIHDFTLVNGVYTFTGLYDEEETLLVEREKSRTQDKGDKMLVHLLKRLEAIYRGKEQGVTFVETGPKHFTIFKTCSYNNLFGKVPTPPPRQLLRIFL